MAQLFTLPKQVPLSSGVVLPGAKAYFYETGTTTPQSIYQDDDLSTPHANPVVADATGTFPAIYINESLSYRLTLRTSADALVYTVDPINPQLTNQVVGVALYPFSVSAEGGAGLTSSDIVDFTKPYGHVYRYKANSIPGTTDMTLGFQRAALVSLTPYAPSDQMVITDSIPLRDKQHWTLDGTQIQITGTTVQVFTVAAGIDDWSITGDWSVTGDNGSSGATSGTAAALKIIDSMRFRVSGLTAKNIKGWGILIQPGSNTASRAEKGQIIAPQCWACYIGIEVQAGGGAEYVMIDNPAISRCQQAMTIAAGNCNVVGGTIVDNLDGVYLTSGTNHAHGTFNGTYINHNSQYTVRADGVTNGHFFIGCNIYEGDIWLKDSQGVLFKSCTVDVDNYYFDGSQGCGFIDCTLPDAYGNVISNSFDSSPSYTIWQGCKKLTGKNDGTLANIKGVLVGCTSSGLAIAAATLASETTLLLTDASNHSANDNAQTLFDGYDATTGIFTCHGLGDGKVRVTALLNVACNSADDAAMATVYAYVRKNNTGVYQYFSRTRISSTSYKFTLDCVVDMQDTDNLRIRMGSSSTLANSITVSATETAVIVEGL